MEFVNCDFIIRILAALLLGFLLGLERELTNKYAGLRTHILVCLGACVFTLLSIYGFPTFATGDNVIVEHSTGVRDTARVAAQIVSGIGFIGAGAVLRNGPMIIGLTTAATLWISAAIGMACGVGMFDVAIISTIFSVAVLTLIRIFEKKILPSGIKGNKRLKFILYTKSQNVQLVHDYLHENVDVLEEFSSRKSVDNSETSKITTIFEINRKKSSNTIYKGLASLYEIDSITIQDLNE